MALARNRRSQRAVDYWPGFVDALSTLLLAIMFLLCVFVLAQFFLSREITGKDEVLNRLTSQINELTQLLALEKSGKQDLEDTLVNLAGLAGRVRRRALAAAADAGPGQRCLGRRQCADRGPQRIARCRKAGERPRAEPDRTAQPADRGTSQPDRRASKARCRPPKPRTRPRRRRSPISAAG